MRSARLPPSAAPLQATACVPSPTWAGGLRPRRAAPRAAQVEELALAATAREEQPGPGPRCAARCLRRVAHASLSPTPRPRAASCRAKVAHPSAGTPGPGLRCLPEAPAPPRSLGREAAGGALGRGGASRCLAGRRRLRLPPRPSRPPKPPPFLRLAGAVGLAACLEALLCPAAEPCGGSRPAWRGGEGGTRIARPRPPRAGPPPPPPSRGACGAGGDCWALAPARARGRRRSQARAEGQEEGGGRGLLVPAPR